MKKNLKGFTLIEMIAAMVIGLVVGTLTYQIIGNAANTYRFISSRNQLTGLIRQVNERMILEIRQATDINTATNQIFEFTIAGSNVIRYEIVSGQLVRNINSGIDRVLVPSNQLNTTGSGFSYFNSTPAAETDVSLIKSVVITLNMVSGEETFTFNQHILLENRRGL